MTCTQVHDFYYPCQCCMEGYCCMVDQCDKHNMTLEEAQNHRYYESMVVVLKESK